LAAALHLGLPLEHRHRAARGLLHATHVVDPTGALALVLGANLGGNTAAAHRRVDSKPSRRLPLGNLLVRAVGVVLALPFLPAITDALQQVEPAPGAS